MDPVPNRQTKSWETRSRSAEAFLNACRNGTPGAIPDHQFALDLTCALGSMHAPECIFEYCLQNSLKHRLIVELACDMGGGEDLVTPTSPMMSPGSQPIPFIAMALTTFKFHAIGAMLAAGIKITYHDHFQKCLSEEHQRIFCSRLIDAEKKGNNNDGTYGKISNIGLIKAICYPPKK